MQCVTGVFRQVLEWTS